MGTSRAEREALEGIQRANVCAACGGTLLVAMHPDGSGFALRCGHCQEYGPEMKARYEPTLKERYRKARSLEGAGFTVHESDALWKQMRHEIDRAVTAGDRPNALTVQLFEQLEREQQGMMSQQALTVATPQTRQMVVYTPEEIEIIKQQIAPGVTDMELQLFIATAQRRGLDPFAKQIYAIRRKTWNPETRMDEYKMVMQTGIDGYRLLAARKLGSRYAGQDRPVFGPMISDPHCVGGFHPEWAEVTAYLMVNGQRVPFTAQVWWDERVQMVGKDAARKPNSMWASQPRGQLAKCAEALTLRKIAPEEMSGLEYGEAQADEPYVPPASTSSYIDAEAREIDYDTGEILTPTSTAEWTDGDFVHQEMAASGDPEPTPDDDLLALMAEFVHIGINRQKVDELLLAHRDYKKPWDKLGAAMQRRALPGLRAWCEQQPVPVPAEGQQLPAF